MIELYIVLWVLPSVLVGIAVGVYIGRKTCTNRDTESVEEERAKTLKALQGIVQSTQKLTQDVGSHNVELQMVEQRVGNLHVIDELADIQDAFLQQVTSLLGANERLEEDLDCTRYQLDIQAQELDRSRHEARTDALAGIPNRKAFDERLHYLLSVHKRQSTPFALVLADIDRFKWINDTHGHLAGDNVVSYLGNLLSENLRPDDFVGRYGGDEFAFLLFDTDRHVAMEIAEEFRRLVEQSTVQSATSKESVAITLSMGLAMVCTGDTAESIIERSDQAVYRSKAAGRNHLSACQEDADQPPCAVTDIVF